MQDHIQFNRCDPQVAARAEDLLARMTLEEKVGQMNQVVPGTVDGLEALIRQGAIGSLLSIADTAEINRLQRIAVEESRLGIPLLIGNDVVHGYRTTFPIPLAESCTWDPDLVEHAARVAAVEAAACGTDWIFAPMVDVCRDPRWGRIAEGAGEDPTLGAAMAAARVRGFQGDDLPGGRRIVACPKHYVAYGAAEAGRDYNTVDLSERTLRDVYLPPFKAALDAGAGSIMSAFNEIGGLPASANPFTLRTVLREEWGFDGVVLSDYNAIAELVAHGTAADLAEAARQSALAGVDMDMMGDAYASHLAQLVRAGHVPIAIVDEAVRRILRLKGMLGLFDRPYTDPALAAQVVLCDAHRQAALEVARKSMVLLQNLPCSKPERAGVDKLMEPRPDGASLLPLSPSARIALIGPLADDHSAPLGCWSCVGRPEDVESVLDGMRALSHAASVTYVQGCAIADEGSGDASIDQIDEAVSAARAADVAVLVLGEGAWMSGEAHSRAHLGLPGHQQALLEAVHAAGTPVVVVLMSGRPLAIPWMASHVPAILQAWHGGMRAGRAVAEILLGQVNPSAKLTTTFPRCEGQIPVYYAHKRTGRPASGPGTMQFDEPFRSSFLDEPNAPLYPFGHGLSYTTFAYSDLQIEEKKTQRRRDAPGDGGLSAGDGGLSAGDGGLSAGDGGLSAGAEGSQQDAGDPTGRISERAKVAITDEATKVATTNEVAQVAITNGATKVATTNEATKVATTNEVTKVAITNGATKVATTNEATKVATTDEATKVATTDETCADTSDAADLDGTLVVSATVTNTGERAGDEIVQLYVCDRVGSVTRPVKELKSFQRISLAPGERKQVRFELPVRRLGFHGLDMRYAVEPGAFKVWVGPSSAEGLEGDFEVKRQT